MLQPRPNLPILEAQLTVTVDYRYKAEPSFAPMPTINDLVVVDQNDVDDEKLPENDVLARGNVIVLTTGFRPDKEMFVVLQSTKLAVYKDESHFMVI